MSRRTRMSAHPLTRRQHARMHICMLFRISTHADPCSCMHAQATCMHLCASTHTCTRRCAQAHTHNQARMYACMLTQPHTHALLRMHGQMCMHERTDIHMQAHLYASNLTLARTLAQARTLQHEHRGTHACIGAHACAHTRTLLVCTHIRVDNTHVQVHTHLHAYTYLLPRTLTYAQATHMCRRASRHARAGVHTCTQTRAGTHTHTGMQLHHTLLCATRVHAHAKSINNFVLQS